MTKSKTPLVSLPPGSVQARSGLHIGFDEMAFLGFIYAVFTLGPVKATTSVVDFWISAFSSIGGAFGEWITGALGGSLVGNVEERLRQELYRMLLNGEITQEDYDTLPPELRVEGGG